MVRGRTEAFKRQRVVRLISNGTSVQVTEKQRTALEVLSNEPDGSAVSELERRGVSAAVLTRLVEKGLAEMTRERVDRDPFSDLA